MSRTRQFVGLLGVCVLLASSIAAYQNGSQTNAGGSQVAITTLNAGGFWAPNWWTPSNAMNYAAGTSSNNVVWVYPITIFMPVTLGRVTVSISGTAAGTCDVGFYDLSGNRLLNTGGFSSAASGFITTTLTVKTLQPGHYLYAQTCDNTTATLLKYQITGDAYAISSNQSVKKVGTAASAASSGVLPATLGTITYGSSTTPVSSYWER